MTEAEWLACTDPAKMLEFLRGKVSDRKLRLFACACCGRIRHLLPDERSQKAVEAAEGFADGLCTRDDLTAAFRDAQQPCFDAINRADGWDDLAMAAIAAKNAAAISEDFPSGVIYHAAVLGDHHDMARQAVRHIEQCSLLREIFGSPFRPPRPLPLVVLAWNNSTAARIAQAIYEERAFDRLPVLADALEEAGCTDPDILSHCRSAGPHVRGCWVVDLILGKQ